MKIFQHKLLHIASLLMLCGVAQAQNGVCVYKDSNYDGPRRCFTQDISSFSDLGINDQISSFQIHGNVSVVFFEHTNYRGANREFSNAQAMLKDGMNDNFSSMRILKSINPTMEWGDRGNWGYYADSHPSPDSDWNDHEPGPVVPTSPETLEPGYVCLYSQRNFKGREHCFTGDDARFENFGFDNDAESIRINGNVEVELFQHADYKGFSRVYRKSVAEFKRKERDQFSAIRIRHNYTGEDDYDYGITQAHACLYPDSNYNGQPYCFSKDQPRFANFDFDNQADSIRIKGNVEIILYQHENYRGFSRVYRNNVPRFNSRDHDQFSSIRIVRR